MTLNEVAKALDLKVRCCESNLERDVTGGYVGDLLSDVIANSRAGSLWITMQVHVNIVAVAVLKELTGIVVVQGREPAEETLKKAVEEHVPILVSPVPAFETAGALSALLTKGP
jgi:hypothetical protein